MIAQIQAGLTLTGVTSPGLSLRVPSPGNARASYERALSEIATTFDLPAMVTMSAITIDAQDLITRMPFAGFAVREPFDYGNGVTGVEHTTLTRVSGEEQHVICCSRITYGDGRFFYSPSGLPIENMTGFEHCAPIVRLYRYLYGRKHRFLERAMNRQVRRNMGVPATYREFVLVGRDSPYYDAALRPSEIAKRLRTAHAVRGHLREYRSERYTNAKGTVRFIPPHVRGQGQAVQVKDYRVSP